MTTQETQDTDRLSKLEGAYEQVNERLRDLGEEMRQGDAALRTDMNERFNELARGQDSLRSEMNTRFNILLVLIGGVWATMIGGFIALFTRL